MMLLYAMPDCDCGHGDGYAQKDQISGDASQDAESGVGQQSQCNAR